MRVESEKPRFYPKGPDHLLKGKVFISDQHFFFYKDLDSKCMDCELHVLCWNYSFCSCSMKAATNNCKLMSVTVFQQNFIYINSGLMGHSLPIWFLIIELD